MTKEIFGYFKERYLAVAWSVAPNYWPEFMSLEEVDNWFTSMSESFDARLAA